MFICLVDLRVWPGLVKIFFCKFRTVGRVENFMKFIFCLFFFKFFILFFIIHTSCASTFTRIYIFGYKLCHHTLDGSRASRSLLLPYVHKLCICLHLNSYVNIYILDNKKHLFVTLLSEAKIIILPG